MDRYGLRRIDQELLKQIEEDWRGSMDQDEFRLGVESTFTHLHANFSSPHSSNDESLIFGLFDHSNTCVALADVINSARRDVFKLLRTYIHPELRFGYSDDHQKKTLVEIYSAVLSGVIKTGQISSIKEVKIYSENDAEYKLLGRIEDNWDEESTGSTARMMGRWLSITRN